MNGFLGGAANGYPEQIRSLGKDNFLRLHFSLFVHFVHRSLSHPGNPSKYVKIFA